MADTRVFLPALVMVALTFVVSMRMLFLRLGEMKRERIHPQAVATRAQLAVKVRDSRASDNFANLFELPVLFYFAVVVAAITGLVDDVMLGLSWAFVALRVAHSAIQCSYNRVMHRFVVFLLGVACLMVIWVWLAHGLLS